MTSHSHGLIQMGTFPGPTTTWPALPHLADRAGLTEVHWLAEAASTNTLAVDWLETGRWSSLPAAMIAETQTAGRGRGTNPWYSSSGSLTATWVMAADESAPHHELPLRSGLAVRDALAECLGPLADGFSVHVKWPNDVMIAGRKVAGLLCQRCRPARGNPPAQPTVGNPPLVDVIGVGVNVQVDWSAAPTDVRRRAGSLHEFVAADALPPSLTEVFVAVSRHLVAARQADPAGRWRDHYNNHNALKDQAVVVQCPGGQTYHGVAMSIDTQGRLVVSLPDRDTPARLIDGTVVAWGPAAEHLGSARSWSY